MDCRIAGVRDLLETREGDYWVATGGGLCRFNPKGRPSSVVRSPLPTAQTNNQQTTDNRQRTTDDPMFTVFYPGEDERTRFVTRLLQDRAGTIWCGTQRGLFRLDRSGAHITLTPLDVGLPSDWPEGGEIHDLCEDHHGTLWIGAASGLYRRWSNGRAKNYTYRVGRKGDAYRCLLEDRTGHLWAGTTFSGLFQLITDAGFDSPVAVHHYTISDGLSSNWIHALLESSDGRFWVATNRTLCEFLSSGSERGHSFRAYPKLRGLGYYEILSLSEDQYGNLWMGTNHAGAMKVARSGFMTFGEEDGVRWISAIFENMSGEVCLVGDVPGNQLGSVAEGVNIDQADPASILYWRRLGRFDPEPDGPAPKRRMRVSARSGHTHGQKFTWLRPNAPKRIKSFFGWGWNQTALQDHSGEWWIISAGGLYRFPAIRRVEDLKTVRPKAVYFTRNGLVTADLFRVFEDSRGDIWISSISSVEGGLVRWERATETLHDISRTEGLPSFKDHAATAFREDRAGNLWIGFSWGGLARYRDGRFTSFTTENGVPAGWIYDLFVDHAGRLWIASTLGGLARLDDPSADRLTFITYTTADGLSSNKATCLTEDRYGRIYVGTARGVDRLDPATRRVKHFTSADGLVPGEIVVLFRDRKGDIWIGNPAGLSRLTPHPDPPPSPPPILINGVRIGGIRQTTSALGETAVALPDLAADKNQLQIDFVGLSFASGESLRYQYQLEGADRDWSALTDQRTVNYANLAPGRYRFLVRAINSDEVVSHTPATITFTILRPVWQRWWFLILAMMVVGLMSYSAYRYRVRRLLELERVRTRIAADLHDDIGSNLSRIALLSEVARRQAPENDTPLTDRLTLVASIARESVDVMSDIVWAINPKRDRLRDLTQRMRRLAEDAFNARNVVLRFRAPGTARDIKLGAEMRREIFLIFKESVNNIVRHAACTETEIDFQIEGAQLVLRLSDNGKGYDSTAMSDGHGLVSMRQRARNLGGELEIASDDGEGTTVTLRAPLK